MPMKVTPKNVTIRDVYNNYVDKEDEGVTAYNGQLNVRPAYQREFVYKDAKRDAVIRTVKAERPLNLMYWAKCPDGSPTEFELLDGQQRTLSICQYIHGDFSIDYQYFFNLTKEEQEKIYDYPLMVFVCDGDEKEKLEWFKTINIATEVLTAQELRNAIYTGPWLTAAKKIFSKGNCAAYNLSKDYVKGDPIRQEMLETAIEWVCTRDNLSAVEDYMAAHQHDQDANDIWTYYQKVIAWIKIVFPTYRKEMKGVEWGKLYKDCKDENYNPTQLEAELKRLMMDEDVTKKAGIYPYLLYHFKATPEATAEKHLSIRTFTDKMKREAYERQNGICVKCKNKFELKDMEADHITPWAKGGTTTADNCQMLCKTCNRTKSDK